MASASPFFEEYRAAYPARPPDLRRQQFADELKDLSGNNDILAVEVAPATGITLGRPQPGNVIDSAKYLWLITPEDVCAAPEFGKSGRETNRGRLAHTNLSGGGEAHAGGEMWFHGHSSIWMTGGSARYQPATESELNAVVEAFKTAGYAVRSAGWDTEAGKPARVFRGNKNDR